MTKIEGPCHKWNPDFQAGIVTGRLRAAHNIKDFLDDHFDQFSAGLISATTILGKLDEYINGLIQP